LDIQPNVKITANAVELYISGSPSGEVVFFRPSDPKMDFMVPLSDGVDGVLNIPLSLFSKGMYKMKIDFEIAENQYYKEEIIVIP
jgi:hypothetical protein